MISQKQDRRDIHSLTDDSTYDPATKVRFVCTSDTHNQTDRYNFQVPDGDVLIHGGDFTQVLSRNIYCIVVLSFIKKCLKPRNFCY